MTAETPGPYYAAWVAVAPGVREWMVVDKGGWSPDRVEYEESPDADEEAKNYNAVFARGVASANERNDAQWETVKGRIAWEMLADKREVLRVIDEERGKP